MLMVLSVISLFLAVTGIFLAMYAHSSGKNQYKAQDFYMLESDVRSLKGAISALQRQLQSLQAAQQPNKTAVAATPEASRSTQPTNSTKPQPSVTSRKQYNQPQSRYSNRQNSSPNSVSRSTSMHNHDDDVIPVVMTAAIISNHDHDHDSASSSHDSGCSSSDYGSSSSGFDSGGGFDGGGCGGCGD